MPRKSRRTQASRATLRSRKARAKRNAGLAPLPKRDYLSKAVIGKSVGFPKTKTVTMKYTERFPVSSALGALTFYQFSANGIYDPNYTSGGHQPYTHDQWSSFYNHYRVFKSRIKVTCVGTTVDPMIIGCYLGDDVTPPVSIDELIESGRGDHAVLPLDSGAVRTVYADFDLSFFGKDIDKGQTTGVMGVSNPNESAYFNIYVTSLAATSNTPQVNFLVEIDYHVRLMEPRDLASS